MSKSSLLFVTVLTYLFLTQACSLRDEYSGDNASLSKESLVIPLTRSDNSVDQLSNTAKPKVITNEALDEVLYKGLKSTSIKDINDYSLKTISENGCPIIHSVNFNNGGWALVAGRELQENQILAFGEEGSFDPDNIDSPEVRFWFSITKRSLIQLYEQADLDSSVSRQGLTSAQEEGYFSKSYSYDDPYVWVRLYIGTEDSTAYYHKGHLTQTKWGQLSPWNYKCPSINGEKCPTGCSTVAVAQMLYYLHYHLGTPSGLYHNIDTSFTWNSNGYYVSNLTRSNYHSPSFRWDSMAISSLDCYIHNSSYVRDFMIDIADRLDTHFQIDGSDAEILPAVFNNYDLSCNKLSYNSSQVITSLKNSMPVLVSGIDTSSTRSNIDGEGHAWLIDGYREEVTWHKHQYKWVIMPPDSLSFYNNINYNYVFTDSEMQRYYPDIEENEIVYTYSTSAPSYLFKMNWGWDGGYSNSLYAILPSGWITGSHTFDYGINMFINFSTL